MLCSPLSIMIRIAGLILAKSDSIRLKNKNTLPFRGEPMFLHNVRKLLDIFPEVYVSSDSEEILDWADSRGAIAIKRPMRLCGDTPNIPVYQHALRFMRPDVEAIIAVQANSPNVHPSIIARIREALELCDEAITVHQDGSIYGSVWGIRRDKLLSYEDPYHPTPGVKIEDTSIDIHSADDYLLALEYAAHDELVRKQYEY